MQDSLSIHWRFMVDFELDHNNGWDRTVCQGELFTVDNLVLLKQLREVHLLQGRGVRLKHA